MNKLLLTIAALLLIKSCLPCPASELTREQVGGLANAIYRAEGGAKARKPYGVLSVSVANEQQARRVCENTIRNNYARWQAGGKRGSYVDFLADRYCPPTVDRIGNANWKANVKKIYGREIR